MGYLLHQNAQVLCSHGGQVRPTVTSLRVTLGGQGATTLAHIYTVAGCPLTTESPKPCTVVQWTSPAVRVTIEGQPALLSSSQGITIGPLGTQGTPMTVMQQVRVSGQ